MDTAGLNQKLDQGEYGARHGYLHGEEPKHLLPKFLAKLVPEIGVFGAKLVAKFGIFSAEINTELRDFRPKLGPQCVTKRIQMSDDELLQILLRSGGGLL